MFMYVKFFFVALKDGLTPTLFTRRSWAATGSCNLSKRGDTASQSGSIYITLEITAQKENLQHFEDKTEESTRMLKNPICAA